MAKKKPKSGESLFAPPPPPPPPAAPEVEPIPICLSRGNWQTVLRALKMHRATPQQIGHVEKHITGEIGDLIVIPFKPDGAKWIATELLRGTELGDDVFTQWHFWTEFDHSVFDQPGRFVFFHCPRPMGR